MLRKTHVLWKLLSSLKGKHTNPLAYPRMHVIASVGSYPMGFFVGPMAGGVHRSLLTRWKSIGSRKRSG
jgi:hypothetical protein